MSASRTQLMQMTALLRPYAARWILATLALLAAGGVNLALPQVVRLAVDDAVARGDLGALDRWTALAVVGFVVLAVMVALRHYLVTWLGQRVVSDLRMRAFRHLLTHPPGYFHAHESGALVSRLTDDINRLQFAVGAELSIALRASITVVGGLALLLWTSPSLTLVMVATMPPLAVGAVWIARIIRRRSHRIQDVMADANAGLQEAVASIETVQVFTAEEREAARYGSRVEEVFRTTVGLGAYRAGFLGGVQLAGYSALAVIVWLGGARIIEGRLSPGELTAFLLYTLMVTRSMGSLAQVWSNLQRAAGSTERIFDILGERPEIRDAPDARPLPAPTGALDFDHVSFTYPTRPDTPVLRDVTFRVAPGERVALVGRSGAGKSTIAALVHRFWDPSAGAVRLDGEDLRAVRLEDLRRCIATVRQEPALFSGTVADNITYGAPDATPEAIRAAARDAWISDFVESLPDGYDTVVGERGVRLSGGQRQRVAIARALLADPRVLILDEATSHLDTTNEALVHRALTRLMEGRTTLVIAHRLSTVRSADRILVLEGGRVVEQGTHDELLAAGGAYAELLSHQALGLVPDDA